jgi:hypothetical protein
MARTTRARLGVGSAGRSGSGGDEVARKRALELAKRDLSAETVVGRPDAPWTVLVYGETGVGKTTMLAQCPGVYFVPVERGANQVRVPQWRNAIASMDELEETLDVLRYGRHDYRAVALETLDAVESLMRERIENRLAETSGGRKEKGPMTIAEWNEAEYGAGYEALLDEWRSLLARLDALREEHSMRVLLSAHSKVDTVPTLDSKEDFKRYAPMIAGRKCAEAVKAWCDYLLFLKTDVHVSKEGRKVMAATGDRHVYLTQKATHDAKCRGSLVFPDRVVLRPSDGWREFEQIAEFVQRYESTGGTRERLVTVLGRLPDERAAALTTRWEELFLARQYGTCVELLDVAEEEARGLAGTHHKTNGAPAAPETESVNVTRNEGSTSS